MAHRHHHSINLPMRPAQDVMQLSRLGAHYPTRLSFMRVLTRHMLTHDWQIERDRFTLNPAGHGEVSYRLRTPNGVFTLVAFSHQLDDDSRTDRVIAERWDLTATLCAGEVTDEHMTLLRENVPKQEAGRLDHRSLVLTRANKSSRSFGYVVDQLAQGLQPEPGAIAKIGYLFRTTAVYGSGKFGMCDWMSVRKQHPDFARPFAAEMFTCFMLRQISFDIAEHVAQHTSPQHACTLAEDAKRYIGIGNATGLGMAPFLICHPLLINQWISCRETALARVRSGESPTEEHRQRLTTLLQRAQTHLMQIDSNNETQNAINHRAAGELTTLIDNVFVAPESWEHLLHAARELSLDTQEILITCLIELFPQQVDSLAEEMCANETFDIRPEQSLQSLKATLEHYYDWALDIDFERSESHQMFWYRSAEKMEPRLGQVGVDDGVDRQMHIDIARQAHELYEYVCDHLARNPKDRVAHFLIQFPALRYIVRRVQTMALTTYGEIRANLLDIDVAPTELMRCKLSFFGVGKFDPQTRLWVRNTMFQGAPLVDDLCDMAQLKKTNAFDYDKRQHELDDWSFPLMPAAHATV